MGCISRLTIYSFLETKQNYENHNKLSKKLTKNANSIETTINQARI